jgi:hypothetical protein
MAKRKYQDLKPLTREHLWANFRDYRSPGGEKPLFVSINYEQFLELRIGAWLGPSLTLTRAEGSCFPIDMGDLSLRGLSRVVGTTNMLNTKGETSNGDIARLNKILAGHEYGQTLNADNSPRQDFKLFSAFAGLAGIRLELMPIPYEHGDRIKADKQNSRLPLALSMVTNKIIRGDAGDTFVPAIPLPVFIPN